MDDLQKKFDVMLAAFMGAIMAQTGCNQAEAVRRIATLCAITQAEVFDKQKAAK